MFWQLGAYAATSYALYRTINRDKLLIKKNLREICEKGEGFFNRQMETLKIDYFKATEWGYNIKVGIPYGLSYQELEEKKELFKTNLGAIDIEMKRLETSSMMELDIITKPLKDLKFKPQETQPYEICLGYSYKENIIVDLNSFPHVLIGGETGSGKSRLLLAILTNLINLHKDIQLYLIQIRKGDLGVFKNCKQTKYFANDLEKARDVLKHINDLCINRDKQIERYIMQGIYNIQDWNNKFPNEKMEYVYLITDEFSFFVPNGADGKEIKRLKNECLGYIKSIVMVGRSVGVFLFTSLQKPSKSSIPADIKSQLTTRISFKQLDDSTSILILGNGAATDLKKREAIVRTIEDTHIKIPYIDHNILMKFISNSIEKNHKFISLNQKESNVIKLPSIKPKTNSSKYITGFHTNKYKKSNEELQEPQNIIRDNIKVLEEVAAANDKENGIVNLDILKRKVK